MFPKIIENHSETSIDVAAIVRRILKHLPPETIDGLSEVVILDENKSHSAFGCYWKRVGRIDLYLDGITLWQPWLLKKTYVFPYLTIGMILGHEIDHHVNRDVRPGKAEELAAERNWLKYVYPSLGPFKPFVRILSWVGLLLSRFKRGLGQGECT